MNENCLLIKTKDHRRFLTHEKHIGSLIEFAKIFHAEIYLAKPEAGQKVMELKALTAAICDSDYKKRPKCQKLHKIYPAPKRQRKIILESAIAIRRYIKRKLLSGKPVSLKDLKEKYKDHNYTDACLCNHLSAIRKVLARQGHRFTKVGAGKYCLTKS